LLGIPVSRSSFPETMARAVTLLAGLGAELWNREADLPLCRARRRSSSPDRRRPVDGRPGGLAAFRRRRHEVGRAEDLSRRQASLEVAQRFS